MVFTQERIKQVVSNPTNYNLIERMVGYDIIDRLVINYFEDSGKYEMNAQINARGYQQRARLDWYEGNSKVEYMCDCHYCTERSACAHIGVLMNFANQSDLSHMPLYYESQRISDYEAYIRKQALDFEIESTRNFIAKQKNRVMEQEYTAPHSVDIEVVLKVENSYYRGDYLVFGFKIGAQKKYVVKNVKTLVKDISFGMYRKYGKNFSFDHSKDAFTENALILNDYIQTLVNIFDNDHINVIKDFNLDEDTVDMFYDTISKIPSVSNVTFSEEPFENKRFPIAIVDHQDYVEVSMDILDDYIVGSKGLYIVQNHPRSFATFMMHKYAIDNQEIARLVERLAEKPLFVGRAHLSDFKRYFLNDIAHYFDISHINIDLPKFDNLIEVYGDINDEEEAVFTIKASRDETVLNTSFDQDDTSSVKFIKVLDTFLAYKPALRNELKTAHFDLNDKNSLVFLTEALSSIMKDATVYVTEALKHLTKSSSSPIRVGLTFSNNLLEVDFESDDIPKEELKDVLQAYKRKKKFYRLKSGLLMNLEDERFESAHDYLEMTGSSLNDMVDGVVKTGGYRIYALNEAQDDVRLNVSKDDSFVKRLGSLSVLGTDDLKVPEVINASLRHYQVEGFHWLKHMEHYEFGGILADDMGLGKTLQAITYFASANEKQCNLVVCPSSVLLNWKDELQKFAPTLSVLVISGPKTQRDALIQEIENHDVVVTSYDYLRRDIDSIEQTTFNNVVLDEAQYIKNHSTQNSKSVKRLKAKQRFALTGTPIENSLAELWSIFDFLMPGYLYSYRYFREHFETPIIRGDDDATRDKLKRLVQPFILRRLKKDVLTDLPDKTEITTLVEFTREEKKLYYANLAQANEELKELTKTEQSNDIQILALLTRLRRLCCDPRTIYENITQRSSKVEAVVDFIVSTKVTGKKMLLFSSFTSVLSLIAQELTQEGISYRIIDGSVPKEERQVRVQAFQDGDVDVFLISLRAGGTGINLTKAEIVIHFDPWWNLSAQNQATDRAYRIGQTKDVFVYKFMMKGSIEEKIETLQMKKQEISNTFIEQAEGKVTAMSKQDIISLFTMDDSMELV